MKDRNTLRKLVFIWFVLRSEAKTEKLYTLLRLLFGFFDNILPYLKCDYEALNDNCRLNICAKTEQRKEG